MKILWFGDIGRPTSFSRISESVIPHLSVESGGAVSCYVLAPPRSLIKSVDALRHATKVYHVGDPIPSIGMTWELFSALDTASPYPSTQSVDAVRSTVLSLKMKYALLQAIQYSKDENIDYIIFVIGIYEADWFMNLYNNARLTQVLPKVIVWTPLDYKPSHKVVENICKADMLFTMTNSGMQSIQAATTERPNIYVVPHAVSKCFYKIPRRKAYKYLKPIIKTLNKDDLVILNANNYVDRKQIHLTIEAFAAVKDATFGRRDGSQTKPAGIKLWLHTNTKNPEFIRMLEYYRKKFNFSEDEIILTMNDASEEMLNNIYNFCQIGLQTSWGEGWSLTNCEHAITGAIQVVPDFLATGEHFRRTGYAYQVGEKEYINEAGHTVTIADIKLENVVQSLIDAVQNANSTSKDTAEPREASKDTAEPYLRGFTWEAIANQIKDLIVM
jgi:glycosyltransferase involved in cell wall biosynthesis